MIRHALVNPAACVTILSALLSPAACSSQGPPEEVSAPKAEATSVAIFEMHVLDLPLGQCIVIDYGQTEAIFGSGGLGSDLGKYLTAAGIVDGPIDLAVVTHPVSDAYWGFERLLKSGEFEVSEIWDPGYDRSESSAYVRFLKSASEFSEAGRLEFRRPVGSTYPPATETGVVQEFEFGDRDKIRFAVLHATASSAKGGSDLRRLTEASNASIVSMITVAGTRILIPGGIYGRDIGNASDVPPKYAEGSLVELAHKVPGALKADILVAPRNGSELSSTNAFIDAVDPRLVVFSAAPRFHLPKSSVIAAYSSGDRKICSTGLHWDDNRDHILISREDDGNFEVSYRALRDDSLEWIGRIRSTAPELPQPNKVPLPFEFASGALDSLSRVLFAESQSWQASEGSFQDVAQSDVESLLRRNPLRKQPIVGTIDLRQSDLRGFRFSDLSSMDDEIGMHRIDFGGADLTAADFEGMALSNIDFSGATLDSADFENARLAETSFNGAQVDYSTFAGASFHGGDFRASSLKRTDWEGALLELDAGKAPDIHELIDTNGFSSVTYERSPHTLIEIRTEAIDKGLRSIENALTYSIEKKKQDQSGWVEGTLRWLLFDLTCEYGRRPDRPLWLIILSMLAFAVPYWCVLRFQWLGSIARVYAKDATLAEGDQEQMPVHVRGWRAMALAIYFSLSSTFNVGWKGISVGTWIGMLQRHDYALVPTGWVRTIRGVQALLSVYLFALWLLVRFGSPFV